MQTLWEALGTGGDLQREGWPRADRWLPEGHPLTKPPILFVKLEDHVIAQEQERLPSPDPGN
jgi:hypothetical protein